MYIEKIQLTDIRCFGDISIDLSTDEGVHMWALILGDNGTGKTTTLRSIAMGLCDETGAAGLLQDTYGDWIQYGKEKAVIEITLVDEKETYKVTTIIKASNGFETLSQNRPDNFPWDKLFICGYGASRSIVGSESYSRYSIADAVYTLFDYDSPLMNPELMLRRRATSEKELEEICSWLDEILMLETGSTKLDSTGLTVNGPWNRDMNIQTVPDGYASTITIISDMLGWALLDNRTAEKNKLHAIVLIDELEQHLHPKWQKLIVRLLNNVFKNIQFITTSHSPLSAIGTANLKNAEEICSLIVLDRDGDTVKAYDKIKPPSNKRADQVLTSHLFGLMTTRSDDFSENMEKYSYLIAKEKKTNEEYGVLEILREKIKTILSSKETELDNIEYDIFSETLDHILRERFKSDVNRSLDVKKEIERKYIELLELGEFNDKD